jgi:hypothetical protein
MSLTSLFFQILFFTTQGSATPSQKEKRGKIVKTGEKKTLRNLLFTRNWCFRLRKQHGVETDPFDRSRALCVSSRSLSLPRAQAPLCFHKPWGSIKVSSEYERENTHSWMQTNNPQKMDEKSERKNCFFFTIVLV